MFVPVIPILLLWLFAGLAIALVVAWHERALREVARCRSHSRSPT